MNRPRPFILAVAALFACASLAQALQIKPNVAPIVSNSIAAYQQYERTGRVIYLTEFFADPDATAAVALTTSLGSMNFTLDGATAPLTVANFLRYVDEGRYFKIDSITGQLASSFIHRSAQVNSAPFVIQGGGFISTVSAVNHSAIQPTPVSTLPAVQNEPAISNQRGTIAMAKLPNNPNSATSQWFINLNDNSGGIPSLDTQNGGFTVFGRVAGNGMTTADAIAALPRYNFTGFADLPLRNYDGHSAVGIANLASVTAIARTSPLVFTAVSSNPTAVTATISETRLIVGAPQVGSAQVTVTATDLDGASISQSFNVTVIPAPGRVRNIATRANFPVGNETLAAGFIVRGGTSKKLIVRGIGMGTHVPGAMDDPKIELVDQNGALIAMNDNWVDSPDKQELIDLQIAPTFDNEAALIATVPSQDAHISVYTARLRNATGHPGIGSVEVYDVDSGPGSTFRNVSTLGPVGVAPNELVGGFIVRGSDSRRLIVRGLGPSLTDRGVAGALPDPTVRLVNNQGMTVDFNDNWETSPDAAEMTQYGLAPTKPKEAAIVVTLPTGEYTATVSGTGATPTGIGQVEVYQVQ